MTKSSVELFEEHRNQPGVSIYDAIHCYVQAVTLDPIAADNVASVMGEYFETKDSAHIIDKLNQFADGYHEGLNAALREQGYDSDVIPPN